MSGYPGSGYPQQGYGGQPGGGYPGQQGGYPGGQPGGYQQQPGGYPGAPGAPPGGAPGYGAPPVDPNVASWFRAVDTDNSGQITAQELQKALVNGNWSNFSEEACRMMIGKFEGYLCFFFAKRLKNTANRTRTKCKIITAFLL